MNHRLALLLILSTFTGAIATTASAVTLVEYPTSGSTTSLPTSIADGSVAALDLEAGAGLEVLSFSTFNFRNWDTDNTSFADAAADDEVFTWGFTVADPTVQIDLTTLDVILDRSGTGPDDFEIRMTLNGASETTVLAYDFADATAAVNFTDVDLSSYSGLTAGDTVLFTLAAFNSESAQGTFDLDRITGQPSLRVSGNVLPIPEPSAALLIALGLVGLTRHGRIE